MTESQQAPSHGSPKSTSSLNALRAAVLGANDGIVSVAGIVVGVAGATANRSAIITAGIAGLAAGAISMAAGEYVSVSSQRDTERGYLAREKKELRDNPAGELAELADIYRAKGLSKKTAQLVAVELTHHDAFAAHAEAELKIDPEDLNNPWHAAFASAVAFTCGAIVPMIAMLVGSAQYRIPITAISVFLALSLTGYLSAKVGRAPKIWAMFRVVIGGLFAMAATYLIGRLVGAAHL